MGEPLWKDGVCLNCGGDGTTADEIAALRAVARGASDRCLELDGKLEAERARRREQVATLRDAVRRGLYWVKKEGVDYWEMTAALAATAPKEEASE